MADRYRYAQLTEPKTIRLLDLHPGKPEDPITITLRESKLSDREKYDALSYEWGTSDKAGSVTCAGGKLAITHNLMLALRRLRRTDRSRALWVDALCINQEDNAERGHQVAHMKDIYAGADHVLAWIGLEPPRAVDAFRLIDLLALYWVGWVVKHHQAAHHGVDLEEKPHLIPDDAELWRAVHELYMRSYFRRMWIVQELAIAHRPPRVICGSFDMSWSRFTWAAMTIARSPLIDQIADDNGLAQVYQLANMREMYQSEEMVPWTRLYLTSHMAVATDDRDKVYGLLGLMDHEMRRDHLVDLLQVDYGLSRAAVYQKAAEAAILGDQTLEFCHLDAINKATQQDLPSWVPNWASLTAWPFPATILHAHNEIRIRTGGRISVDSDVLHVQGFLVFQVGHTSPIIYKDSVRVIQHMLFKLSRAKEVDEEPCEVNDKMTLDELDESVRTLSQRTYRGKESTYDALWRTLIANTADGELAPDSFRRHFDAVIDLLRSRAHKSYQKRTKYSDETVMDTTEEGIGTAKADAAPFMREFYRTVARRVFLTTSGGFMGFASPNVAVGDHVAILEGGLYPFILREQGDGFFEMIGDSYVHGLKDDISEILRHSNIQRIKIR